MDAQSATFREFLAAGTRLRRVAASVQELLVPEVFIILQLYTLQWCSERLHLRDKQMIINFATARIA